MNLGSIIDERILALPILLFSIVVHEFAHAYTAYRAGDMTAKYLGRLTLNPIAHLDPIGTVLIPILQFIYRELPLIGWAKPVPVNPLRFRSSEWDIFVSLAGPGSNFILAVLAALLLKLFVLIGLITSMKDILFVVAMFFIGINVSLGVFNLIPIPPLDGSRVLYRLLASAGSPLADRYAAIEPYGFFILILILASPAAKLFYVMVHFCQTLLLEIIF